MNRDKLKKMIEISSGRKKADLVIKNCKIVNVFSGEIIDGDIAVCDDTIVGIGDYDGQEVFDAKGMYASSGFIESHIHVESSYLSPEELSKIVVPLGTTTMIADPHEIVNVCGIDGLDYMINASKNSVLDIKFALPSCVPATSFENSGAIIDAQKIKENISRDDIIGLGEFMNFVGVVNADDEVIDKIVYAKNAGKIVDGHAPNLSGKSLNAYSCTGIIGDHECATLEDMQDRIRRGMYVLMRQGSACHDLRNLIKGVTKENSHMCLLCSDDRQPKTILEEGHIDNHLRICVEEGINPITAIQMATLNPARAFRLYDKGAIAPSYKADIVLFDNLKDFNVKKVFINGKLVAQDNKPIFDITRYDMSKVKGSVKVKEFSKEKLKMNLKKDEVNVIELIEGSVVTKKSVEKIQIDKNGEFVRNKEKDIVKIAVVERHNYTGNVSVGFIKGYGIKSGAVALSVAHDSHNIIAVGVSDDEIEFAVNSLIQRQGGIVVVQDNKVLADMPMPIAGLMSDKDANYVIEKLSNIHLSAEKLGINSGVEPVMTLCFMSLPVIPEIKISDMGLFDVEKFDFISIENEG